MNLDLDPAPARLLVAGDTHGDTVFVRALFAMAQSEDCQAIVQLGDFGFWEHEPAGVEFLDQVARLCLRYELPLVFIDGNHENHSLLRARYTPGLRLSGCGVPDHPDDTHEHITSEDGFWPIRRGLYYAPRGLRWSWGQTRLLAAGGAYSIDKAWRLAAERAPSTLWWPEEELTEAELARICADRSEVDIVLAHDAPAGAEPEGLAPIAESVPQRERLRAICEVVRPTQVLHGHLHRRHTAWLHLREGQQVRVDGLASNLERRGSWLVVSIKGG